MNKELSILSSNEPDDVEKSANLVSDQILC